MTRYRAARRPRGSGPSSVSSLNHRGEVALFVSAWCDAVERMPSYELRERGTDMLEVLNAAVSGTECPPGGDEESELLSTPRLPLTLRTIARERRPRRVPRSTPLDRRVEWLSGILKLDQVERDILRVLARVAVHDEWAGLLSALPGKGRNLTSGRIAFVTGVPASRVEDRVVTASRLTGSGMVDVDCDGEISPSAFLARIARSQSGPTRLASQLMPAAAPSTLSWDDFAHLGPQRDILERLVASQRGASILLYGPPGTGKTEFALLLAARTNMRAVFAGLSDEDGKEPHRCDRIAHFTVLRALTRNCPSRLLVMDEADDILQLSPSESRTRQSKLWLNRLVEESERPTIWIINEPRLLEESVVRRMSAAVEFPRPPLPVRKRVVRRHAKKSRLSLTQEEVDRLAHLPAAPALLSNAVQSAKRIGGGVDEAWLIGEGLVTVMAGRPPTPFKLPPVYAPELAAADTDLEALAQRLSAGEDQTWSLLLSGPSGTGKSAYARHLAERMSLEVIEKRGSDLLGMYVGETEANIAQAFREASRSGALLLIDEADEFLTDRREASRSWERSMVNEMLRQMEGLQAPFVATTNLADRLDSATQRRFTLKVNFQSLSGDRAATLFHGYFGRLPPAGVRLLNQTPGDFAVVAKRASVLGETNPSILARWLRLEAEARVVGRAIGF